MKPNPFNAKLPPARGVDKTTVLHSARAHVPARCRATASLAAAVLTTALAGCSRTVTWEEEVPLNTGETIVIQRSMPWELRGGFGNPFDIAMHPSGEETIRFRYRQREYLYSGRAKILWLAISPSLQPILVARAGDRAWASLHNYFCVVPYYVQFIPDATGKQWTWPAKIDAWLYGLPANVMASIPTPSDRKPSYPTRAKDERDAVFRLQSPTGARIEPLYMEDGCIHEIK